MIRSEARLSRRPWGITREKRGFLANVNEQLLEVFLTLHATKGYRKVNLKSSMASTIVQAVKSGKFAFELQTVRKAFRDLKNNFVGIEMTLGEYK